MLKTKPSAKIHRRYLLLSSTNKKQIEQIILDYIGILGWANAKPQFIKKSDKLILTIDRKALAPVRAAFELSPSKIKILKVSGTLKGLKIK